MEIIIFFNILAFGRLHNFGSLTLKQSIIIVLIANIIFIPLFLLCSYHIIELSDKLFYLIAIIFAVISIIIIEYISRKDIKKANN